MLLYVHLLVCMCAYMCAHLCVCILLEWGCLRGQLSVCPICYPTLLTPKGMAKKGGEFILEKGIGSSGVMGNNAGFTDGKRQRTPAGCVEANLPTSLTKQLATPVKI